MAALNLTEYKVIVVVVFVTDIFYMMILWIYYHSISGNIFFFQKIDSEQNIRAKSMASQTSFLPLTLVSGKCMAPAATKPLSHD